MQINSPFTSEQVAKLQEWQDAGYVHPFTCCSAGSEKKCQRRNNTGDGVLIPTEMGWVCPCGEYKQDWAHHFMTELPPNPFDYDSISRRHTNLNGEDLEQGSEEVPS